IRAIAALTSSFGLTSPRRTRSACSVASIQVVSITGSTLPSRIPDAVASHDQRLMEVHMATSSFSAPSDTAPQGLRRNAIGLREVLFQSITDMAPGAAIAASIPAGAAFAGGSLPLAVVFALIACLFTAVSIGELAGHMPAAGSLATYAAQGLHK